MYHVSVPSLPEKLLDHIRKHELLKPGDRVGIALSGGADSVALLCLLLDVRKELGLVLSVIHFNHKLRGAESDDDQEFVSGLAREHGLELYATAADVVKHAVEARMSIEAAARELRYDYFGQLLNDKRLDKVATGHTLDDQAETVLMRLIRGTGMRGLRAIQPRIRLDDEAGEVVRPLLCLRRSELLAYLNSLGQSWREDSTNQEAKFTRNRVRQLLLPLLEREFNPSITQNLAELAEIARAEEDYWESEVQGWMGTVVQWVPAKRPPSPAYVPLTQLTAPPPEDRDETSENERMDAVVDRNWLLAEPLALQRRAVKSIADYAGIPLEYKHVDEILQFAASHDGSGNQLTLPRGWKLFREGASLEFKAPEAEVAPEEDYEYPLSMPGEVKIAEINLMISTIVIPAGSCQGYERDHLFDPAHFADKLLVRNWRPGDRFWAAHTKSHKKIKELLQEKRIPQNERKLWPVVVSGDEIIWVRGFQGRAHFRPAEGNDGILIREQPLSEFDRD
jgi:tRNA(Ile)-lysidine synthase